MCVLCTYSLFMVGNDTPDKVGVRVPKRGHQFGEGLLIELAHSAEHALLGLICGTERCLIHTSHLVQAHNTVHYSGTEG